MSFTLATRRLLLVNRTTVLRTRHVPCFSNLRQFSADTGLPTPPTPADETLTLGFPDELADSFVSTGADSIVLAPGVSLSPYSFFTAPIDTVVCLLDSIHTWTALPWWQSIVVFAVTARALQFPLMISQKRNAARMKNMKPELELLQAKIARNKDDPTITVEKQKETSMELWHLYTRYGTNPLKMLAPIFIQLPVGLISFWSLQRLCQYEALTNGGAYWFTDLTVPDPMYLLAIGTSAGMLTTMKLGETEMSSSMDSEKSKMMKKVMMGVGLMVVPGSMFLPAGVILYLGGTTLTLVAQSVFFKVPFIYDQLIMKYCKLPVDIPTPDSAVQNKNLWAATTPQMPARSSRRAQRRREKKSPAKN